MAKRPKTIITCAITGAIHTPTMSDALPYHARRHCRTGDRRGRGRGVDPASACPQTRTMAASSIDPDDFAAFLPRIKQATDAVVNISTGGSLKNTIEDRIAPALTLLARDVQPEHGVDELLLPPAGQTL